MIPPYTRESLVRQTSDERREKFLFFWGHTAKPGSSGKECLSQWFPASFEVDGVRYATAEHYMMACKASLFDDADALRQILSSKSPAEAKKIGRTVKRFSDSVWNDHRFDIVVEGSVAKFDQNPAIREFLLNTRTRVLVEASPRDRIWGIGLGQSNRDAEHPDKWRGLNLLGFALMAARDRLAETR